MRTRHLRATAAAVALLAALTPAAALAKKAKATKAAKPAALTELVKRVDIPYEQFTLDNGLRVIVHTDRKAPIVAVSIWYGVGSADEPKGKTGFAHLFEHLMFNGSGNWDSEFFTPLEEVGATDSNGTTWFDRTNYFQNVPTQALDLALFLEADRMGNLLPAVTQEKLDNQRGVVQNEKRQGDSQPYGLVEYAGLQNLFPEGHPYHHSTIGSMADLDAATLETAQAWFKQFYGPNNAVLVLAGDVDVATAKPLVEKYFASIPRGPDVAEPKGGVPDRVENTRTVLKDRVGAAQLNIGWAVPSQLTEDFVNVDIAISVLASGDSSRLYNALVREAQVATAVSGFTLPFQISSTPSIIIDIKPGVDPAEVEAKAQAVIEQFLAEGPTPAELQRVATGTVAGNIRGLEQIGGFGGKAVTLAEGALYANDPSFYKTRLARYAAATPKTVQAAAKAWLADGSHRVLVVPGERGELEKQLEGAALTREPPPPQPAAEPDRSKLPKVQVASKLDLPEPERATLSNGVQVTLVRRADVPVVRVLASFDAGGAADSKDKPGLQRLALNLMRAGTASRTGQQIAEEAELLGLELNTGAGGDTTTVSISALAPNLGPSLALMSDVIRNPAFAQAELDRLRAIQITEVAQEESDPIGLLLRTLRPRMFGPDHPYGLGSALGTKAGLQSITRDDLTAFHQAWIRPDTMQVFVVGDISMAALKPQLEKAFGDWRPAAGVAKGEKRFAPPAPQGQGKVFVLNRPGPSSVIAAAMPLPLKGTDDPIALTLANETLGGAFSSRLNIDLRETKGWSYGAGSQVTSGKEDLGFLAFALVQADRTADSVAAMKEDIKAFLTSQPITPEELDRGVKNNTLSLPGSFETGGALLGALQQNAVLGRPDDYHETLAARYRALTPETVTAAAKAVIDPDKLIYLVVGDAEAAKAQFARLGMEIVLLGEEQPS